MQSSPEAATMPASPDAARFLVKLARGLHTYGTPAHQIEQALEIATQRVGLPTQFFSLPTVILAAFGAPEQRSTALIRVQPSSVDLEKLVLLDDVLKGILRGELRPTEAEARIDAVEALPPRFGAGMTVGAFALASACAARYFGGSLREVGVAALLGTVAAALGFVQCVRPGFQRVYKAAAAFVVSFFALLLAAPLPGLSSYVVTVASLVVLLPGLALTMAIAELAAQSLVSGTVRLVSAAVVLVELTFGVALGRAAASRCLDGEVASALAAVGEIGPLPAWTLGIALALAPCAYLVLFRAPPRDLLPIVIAGAVGFAGDRVGCSAVGPELGAFFGAFAVALGSNVWARWIERPVAVTLLPGILLLVPGSVGFRGATLLLERDVVIGVEVAFQMLFVAAAIVAGLLFANVMVPARRAL